MKKDHNPHNSISFKKLETNIEELNLYQNTNLKKIKQTEDDLKFYNKSEENILQKRKLRANSYHSNNKLGKNDNDNINNNINNNIFSPKINVSNPIYHNKNKKFYVSKTTFLSFKLSQKYKINENTYNKKKINELIYNISSHCTSCFKEFLIEEEEVEFLKRFYHNNEITKKLSNIFYFYENYSKIFPNYIVINEGKYIYKNILKKQKIIDEIQSYMDKKNNKNNGSYYKENNNKTKDKNNEYEYNESNEDKTKLTLFTNGAIESIYSESDSYFKKNLENIMDLGLDSFNNNTNIDNIDNINNNNLDNINNNLDNNILNNNNNNKLVNLINLIERCEINAKTESNNKKKEISKQNIYKKELNNIYITNNINHNINNTNINIITKNSQSKDKNIVQNDNSRKAFNLNLSKNKKYNFTVNSNDNLNINNNSNSGNTIYKSSISKKVNKIININKNNHFSSNKTNVTSTQSFSINTLDKSKNLISYNTQTKFFGIKKNINLQCKLKNINCVNNFRDYTENTKIKIFKALTSRNSNNTSKTKVLIKKKNLEKKYKSKKSLKKAILNTNLTGISNILSFNSRNSKSNPKSNSKNNKSKIYNKTLKTKMPSYHIDLSKITYMHKNSTNNNSNSNTSNNIYSNTDRLKSPKIMYNIRNENKDNRIANNYNFIISLGNKKDNDKSKCKTSKSYGILKKSVNNLRNNSPQFLVINNASYTNIKYQTNNTNNKRKNYRNLTTLYSINLDINNIKDINNNNYLTNNNSKKEANIQKFKKNQNININNFRNKVTNLINNKTVTLSYMNKNNLSQNINNKNFPSKIVKNSHIINFNNSKGKLNLKECSDSTKQSIGLLNNDKKVNAKSVIKNNNKSLNIINNQPKFIKNYKNNFAYKNIGYYTQRELAKDTLNNIHSYLNKK